MGFFEQRLPFAVLAVAATACSGAGGGHGGDGPAYCQSVNTFRSYTNGSCVGCSISDQGAVADGDLFSFADFNVTMPNAQASLQVSSGGAQFPAGSTAAAFFTAQVSGANTTTLHTYLSGVEEETATGPALTFEPTNGGTDAASFVSFQTTLPFDAVGISFSVAGNTNPSAADLRVYELCANGHV